MGSLAAQECQMCDVAAGLADVNSELGIRKWLPCPAALTLLQDCARRRIHQHGKSVAHVVAINLHQGSAFAFDAAAEHPSQAQQRPAAADLASLASAVAHDLAVGT